MIESLNI